ncbi:MAG: phosphatase PAP2 family protein [Bacillota bacterium]|nr:phosphatase PAP2 family protein [Bacillota bacterium]
MEEAILRFLQSWHSPWFDTFFVGITMLGEEYFYLLTIAILYWCFNKRFAFGLAFAMLTSTLVNGAVKELVQAPRPFETMELRVLRKETATGTSFPSGHTQCVSTFFSYLTMFAGRYWFALAFGITVLVALSRMYLGVHWPKDVIFGAILGLVIAAGAGYLYRKIPSQAVAALGLLVALVSIWFGRSPDLLKAAGAMIGLAIGHFYETSSVRFAPSGTIMSVVGRSLFGAAITAAFYLGMKWLIPELYVLRYAIVVFVIVGLVPTVFEKEAATLR